MTDISPIRTDVADGIMTLTLNRPDKLNALSWPLIEAMLNAMHAAERDPAVHAIIVRGEGRAFCSGFDFTSMPPEELSRDTPSPHDDMQSFRRAAAYWRDLWELRKPVIAAVHGYCLAAGMEIVVHADIAIASDDAVFGYPPVRASGLPDTHMFLYHLGPQWTKRLLLTGDTIDAATAERIGLILKTVPRDELEDEALALARSMKQVPLPILEGAKNVINHGIELMGYTALQRQNWNESAMVRANEEIMEFGRIVQAEGLKAALKWRDDKAKSGASQA